MKQYISFIKYKYSNKLIVNIHSSNISAIKYVYSYIVNALRYHKKLPFYIKNIDDLKNFFNTYPTKFEWHITKKKVINDEEDDDYERDIETCTIHN
jgi:hypothetical protein